MIHLEGVFYIIIVLYHTSRALPVIHRVMTPLRVVLTPVLTHLFIQPFIGVKQQGPTLYELSIFRVDPQMCVIYVWLHLEGAWGKLEQFEQLQNFTLSPTQIRE